VLESKLGFAVLVVVCSATGTRFGVTLNRLFTESKAAVALGVELLPTTLLCCFLTAARAAALASSSAFPGLQEMLGGTFFPPATTAAIIFPGEEKASLPPSFFRPSQRARISLLGEGSIKVPGAV